MNIKALIQVLTGLFKHLATFAVVLFACVCDAVGEEAPDIDDPYLSDLSGSDTEAFCLQKAPLIVLSGPSGVGKSAIQQEVLKRVKGVTRSTSVTTRTRRKHEGPDYLFVSNAGFEKLIADGALVEYKEKYGHYYGTLISEVEKPLLLGQTLLLNMDECGTRRIKQLFPEAVAIFITPGTYSQLESRLRGRGSESEAELRERVLDNIEQLQRGLSEGSVYDYFVENGGEFETAVDSVISIVRAQQLRYPNRAAIDALLAGLPGSEEPV